MLQVLPLNVPPLGHEYVVTTANERVCKLLLQRGATPTWLTTLSVSKRFGLDTHIHTHTHAHTYTHTHACMFIVMGTHLLQFASLCMHRGSCFLRLTRRMGMSTRRRHRRMSCKRCNTYCQPAIHQKDNYNWYLQSRRPLSLQCTF
jgi:hypothetical protein